MECRVTDFTQNGKCSNCGECCSNMLPLSNREISDIKRYIKKHNIKEQRHNAIAGTDMSCPFRSEKSRKCLIYPVRPQICKSFMCNHTIEDIAKNKEKLHSINKVVMMRSEFFGNTEDAELMKNIFTAVLSRAL